MWAVATLVFFMLRILPGDPLAAMLFEADPLAADELRIKFGLDQPMIVQYWKWFMLMAAGRHGQFDLRLAHPGQPDPDRGGAENHLARVARRFACRSRSPSRPG